MQAPFLPIQQSTLDSFSNNCQMQYFIYINNKADYWQHSNTVCATDFSNDHADISSGNYQRCLKIITAGHFLPEWGHRWYRSDNR